MMMDIKKQHGVLASGGGTADRHITFRSVLNGQILSSLDTGSQVCNLAFNSTGNEIVSTHGYSQNQISLWRVKDMKPLATLTGHTTRVLYLAVSPDETSIVTGAGDETLRFWNVFAKRKIPESKLATTHYLR
jgi:cell division cycle 20-like protein 1 (cofactor of APC complex)